MKLFRRSPPSPFTWKQRLTGEATVALQDKDISKLRTLSLLMESLDKPPLHTTHPLRDISSELKLKVESNDQGSFLKNMFKLEEFLEERVEREKTVYADFPLESEETALETDNYMKMQTALRLTNLQYYCKNLKEISMNEELAHADSTAIRLNLQYYNSKNLKEISLNEELAHADSMDAKHVIDSFLLGSGAERTAGHLRIAGERAGSFTQALLQSTYYSILEPEVATVTEAASTLLGDSKDHVKAIKKVTPIYLLDKLELNVKSRCVFAWSDPKYVGYQPLDDDQVVPAKDIYSGSYEYFPEATSVGKQFMDKYISDRQVLYHEANETSSNLKYGAVFFVVTCVLDQLLYVM